MMPPLVAPCTSTTLARMFERYPGSSYASRVTCHASANPAAARIAAVSTVTTATEPMRPSPMRSKPRTSGLSTNDRRTASAIGISTACVQ